MTSQDLYIDGRRVDLAKQIGRGGEGDVFLLAGQEQIAVKVYKEDKRRHREEKVRAIVKESLAAGSKLVAFPQSIVTTKSGNFMGFTMRLVSGFRPIHELYSPKSRKIHYPTADYRFLIRVAANVARAIGEVHSSSCVVGDLNHSGILVSNEATVALIDADSFQITASGKTFPCLVGVPEFTPPELQGRDLGGVLRTRYHDYFGLAVTIFQLLFMGRHPYAGQQSGTNELTLDQLIARNYFAYSRQRKVGLPPSSMMATLDDFPMEVGEAFERSFGVTPSNRTSTLEWIDLLKNLERKLSNCSLNRIHFFPSAANTCPWCRMEQKTGAILFIGSLTTLNGGANGLNNFNIDNALAAIEAIILPDPKNTFPKLPKLAPGPSAAAQSVKRGRETNQFIGLLTGAIAIVIFEVAPQIWPLWIGALVFAWHRFNKDNLDAPEWRRRYNEYDRQWQQSLDRWRQRIGIFEIIQQKEKLKRAASEFRSLPSAKAAAISSLQSERHVRQKNEYLDRFMISKASIQGIGPAKKMILISFGIETAADIKYTAITAISGFGPQTAKKLMTWRERHERRFIYNPAPLPSDALALDKVEAEFSERARKLATQISGGQVELTRSSSLLRAKLDQEDKELVELASQIAQLKADLKFIGISYP